MTQAHSRTVGTYAEVIEILVAISQVSARMARQLSILAARQSEKGECRYEQNERFGYGNRRVTKRCSHY